MRLRCGEASRTCVMTQTAWATIPRTIVLARYHPEMAAAMARFPSTEWVRVAREYGVPLQQVRTPEEGLADPAFLDEGVVVVLDDPTHGPLREVGLVYRFSETPGKVQGPASEPGAHTTEVRAVLAREGAELARGGYENGGCGDGGAPSGASRRWVTPATGSCRRSA